MTTLTFHANVSDLRRSFGTKFLVEMVKQGEFKPEKGLLHFDFQDEQIAKIAEAQLKLLVDDLNQKGAKAFTDKNYLSAMQFLDQPEFISVCSACGIGPELAQEQALYLKRRYSKEYVEELFHACKGECRGTAYSKTIEFAYEMGQELFEMRLGFVNFEKQILLNAKYWERLNSSGVQASVVKRVLENLWWRNSSRTKRKIK